MTKAKIYTLRLEQNKLRKINKQTKKKMPRYFLMAFLLFFCFLAIIENRVDHILKYIQYGILLFSIISFIFGIYTFIKYKKNNKKIKNISIQLYEIMKL